MSTGYSLRIDIIRSRVLIELPPSTSRVLMLAITMRKDLSHRKSTGVRTVICCCFEVRRIIDIRLVRRIAIRAHYSELLGVTAMPEFVTNLLNSIRAAGGVQRKVKMLGIMIEVRCRASLV